MPRPTRATGLLLGAGVALSLAAGLGPAGAAPTSPDDHGTATAEPRPYDALVPPPAPAPPASARPGPQGYAVAPGDPRGTVDIAVLGTTRAVSAAGGTAAFATFAQRAVDQTNQVFASSGVTTRLRLVGTGATATAESTSVGGTRADLEALRAPGDGRFDEAHPLRERFHADIVHLLVEGTAGDNTGFAYIGADAASAFAVTHRQYAIDARTYTFAHETGHVFGADHDPAAANARTPLPARGYFSPTKPWHTVMAYPTACNARHGAGRCLPIPHFSNPRVAYQGEPTGTAEADNASVIEARAGVVAAMRQSQIHPVTPILTSAPRHAAALTADPGTWLPVETVLSYQWYVAGAPVPGATAASYTPAVTDVGQPVSVLVTGTAPHYAPVQAASAPATVAPGLIQTRPPKLTGRPRVGGRLVVALPGWQPAVRASYRWLRNGSAIKGATGKAYRVRRTDRGKRISVVVTAAQAGYETAVEKSRKVKIR